jgi:hypothetical protein
MVHVSNGLQRLMFDVFMIKFDEPNAGAHWARLRAVAPHAILIEGICGIRAVHAQCAERASTPHFFVVDADSWILDGFSFQVDFCARNDQVAVWRAKNPVNGLVYGNGGIKLFPRNAFRHETKLMIDLATSLTCQYRKVPVVASEHRFNLTPFLAWRSAFRECVKLASRSLPGSQESVARRLATWCSVANTERYSTWCLRGARDGRKYGTENINDPENLILINDYSWLKNLFLKRYGVTSQHATDEARKEIAAPHADLWQGRLPRQRYS